MPTILRPELPLAVKQRKGWGVVGWGRLGEGSAVRVCVTVRRGRMPRKKVWEQEIRWFSRNWMRMLWCVGVRRACTKVVSMAEGGRGGQ